METLRKKGLSILVPVVLVIVSIGLSIFLIMKSSSKPISEKNVSQACIENWECGSWSACTEQGTQSRTCTDLNSCGTTENKSSTTQSCTYGCIENWQCTDWSYCVNEQKTRTCTDTNSCGTTNSKPPITQSCTYGCIENWSCGSWSSCTQQGTQTRTCTDLNSCGTTNNKPSITQSCTYGATCSENWECGSWSACTEQGTQSRTCTDTNSCGTTNSKPSITQSCTYVEPSVNISIELPKTTFSVGEQAEISYIVENLGEEHKFYIVDSCAKEDLDLSCKSYSVAYIGGSNPSQVGYMLPCQETTTEYGSSMLCTENNFKPSGTYILTVKVYDCEELERVSGLDCSPSQLDFWSKFHQEEFESTLINSTEQIVTVFE